jgi:dTDP-glucose 4,6-dehydratase
MKTILVTGGAGFIGANFVEYLCGKYSDYKVVVLDALTYAGSIQNLPEKYLKNNQVEFYYGNVLNTELVNNLVKQSDFVIHFAAESHVTRSIFDNSVFFETDVLGTQVVANAVLKHSNIERFIHISTSEVYGTAVTPKMDEDHPLNPMSPYAAAKCGADRLIYSYYHTYKLPVTILRPFNQYGFKQHLEKAIPRFITSCLLSENLVLHGDGNSSRDWTYVEDTCHAIDLVLHANSDLVVGEVFNIGNEENITIKKIAHLICNVMGTDSSNIVHTDDRPAQVIRHTCNSKKIKDVLGWEPQVSLREGLEKTSNWYRQNQYFWESQIWLRKVPIETEKGIKKWH